MNEAQKIQLETDLEIQRLVILKQRKLLRDAVQAMKQLGPRYETRDVINRIEKMMGNDK